MPSTASTATEAADLGGRLVALVVDAVVIVLAATPLALLAGADPGSVEIVLVWFVYRSLADGLGGSLGKRLLGMRIIGAEGPRAGLAAGAARNLWSLSALLPAFLPPAVGNTLAVAVSAAIAVTIARDDADRGWHDRLGGTAVRRPA